MEGGTGNMKDCGKVHRPQGRGGAAHWTGGDGYWGGTVAGLDKARSAPWQGGDGGYVWEVTQQHGMETTKGVAREGKEDLADSSIINSKILNFSGQFSSF